MAFGGGDRVSGCFYISELLSMLSPDSRLITNLRVFNSREQTRPDGVNNGVENKFNPWRNNEIM